MTVTYSEKEFKTILNKMKYIDNWFWCRYTLNPYNGCEFACTYCDSRSHKYHLHTDFDQQIFVKTNAGSILDDRLRRARTLLPDVVAIGGTCDAYQPAEAHFENTRRCLEVLCSHHYPVCISTKSTLVVRDLDILSRIAEDTWCTVSVTVTTRDECMARFLEPGAPLPERRLEVIRTLKRHAPHIHAGVHLIPVIPFLCDGHENLESIVRGAKESGADFILFGGGMTLRDNQASWFFSKLGEEYPHLIERFKRLYQANYSEERGYTGRYEPLGSYLTKINRLVFALCEKYHIASRNRRFIPDDFRHCNYLVAERLLYDAYVAQIQGAPWTNIFWAGQHIQNLTESIASIAARGELQTIRNIGPVLEQRIVAMLEQNKNE